MTIESQKNKVVYKGNGVTTNFPFPYPPVADGSHLRLYRREGGVEEVITGGYSVVGAGSNQVTVSLREPLPVGVQLTLVREVPYTQKVDLQNQGAFNADVVEGGLDNLEMQIIQLKEVADRSLKFPVSDDQPNTNSQDYLDQVKKYADDARASAERAASLSDPGALASSIYNIRRAWVLEADVAAGEFLQLPGVYFPTRNVLQLSYQGVVCAMRGPLIEPGGQYQYSEVGEDMNEAQSQVVLHFPAKAGDVFDMWVTHCGLSGSIDQTEEALADAREAALEAGAARDAAIEAANEAIIAAQSANTVYTAISDVGIDLNNYFTATVRAYFKTAAITNSPISGPLYFTNMVNSEMTSATQTLWNLAESTIYLRTVEIEQNANDPNQYTAIFSIWREIGGSGSTIPEFMIGMIVPMPHRATALPAGLYFCNGDLYPKTSPQGIALLALPSQLRADFGIAQSGENISLPNMFSSDGRGYSIRFVDGATRTPGSVEEDMGREITGYAYNCGRNSSSGAAWGAAGGAFSISSGSTSSQTGSAYTTNSNAVLNIKASDSWGAAHTGKEFTMLNVGFTPAIILGV